MLKYLLLSAVLSLCASSCLASEEADHQALMDAWRKYSELAEAGDYEASLPHAQRVFELGEKVFPENDKQLAAATLNYGRNLLYVNRKEEAGKILKIALRRFENLYGKNEPELIDLLLSVAAATAGPPRFQEQQQFVDRAYDIAASNFVVSSTEYADTLIRIAQASYFYPPSVTTGDSIRKALHIYKAQAEPSASRVGNALAGLGVYHAQRGEYKESERRYREALDSLDPSDEDLLELRDNVELLLKILLDELATRSDELAELASYRNQYDSNPDVDGKLPIVRVAPVFPAAALRKRSSGYVDIQHTVDEQGFVINPQIIDSTGHESFRDAAIGAVLKFRYIPKQVDGQPVAVQGVRTRISFELED